MATSLNSDRSRRRQNSLNRSFRLSCGEGNMKHGLICQPRVKIAKLTDVSKQKMACLSPSSENEGNGEKNDVCLAEIRKMVKNSEIIKPTENVSDKSLEGILTDIKPNVKEPKLSKEESQETRQLKELLLLHLDLIQQQQELLNMKDRQLQQVTQEKESLRCRLERMERRMQLLKQNNSLNQQEIIDSSLIKSASCEKKVNRGIKRKSSLEPQSLVKKFATIARNEYHRDRSRSQSNNQTPKSETPQRTPRTREQLNRSRRESEHDETSSQSSKHSNKASSIRSMASSKNKTKITFRTPHKRRKTERKHKKRIPKDDKIMKTDIMYYVPNEEIVPMDISPRKTDKSIEQVEVPSFRIKVIPRGYTMEGTENLGDEVYLKRHQKPENDEKRRKRWDMQRLREQRAMERLQQSRSYRNGNGQGEEEDFETFLPDPDKVEYIEVCDDIPVSAFGLPLPKVENDDFSLPWFNAEKHEQETRRQKSRKR